MKSVAVGVGKKEQALSMMWCSTIGCSCNAPLRIPPDFGKVSEDLIEPKAKVPCDVFQECELGS